MSSKHLLNQIEQEEKIRRHFITPTKQFVLELQRRNTYLSKLVFLQFLMNRLKNLCENCSKCCEVSDIDLNPYDIERMAHHLKRSQHDFVSEYCVKHPEYPSILYRFKNKPCVFLENKRCKIYQVRPNMCMFFPFLTGIQKEAWQIYEKKKMEAIVLPLWCASAVKIKEVYEKMIKTWRQLSREDQEKALQ